jgi:hypothetical protein
VVEVSVYVIAAGDSAVKVGLAMRPRERLRALQTAHYERLSLFDSVVCTEQEAPAVESKAHRLLKDRRRSGEWFSVSPEEAKNAVLEAKRQVAAEGCKDQTINIGRERSRKPWHAGLSEVEVWPLHEKVSMLTAEDMELAKLFFGLSELQGAIADDCCVGHEDYQELKSISNRIWPRWDWEEALIRLSSAWMDFSEFNATAKDEHNWTYSRSRFFNFSLRDVRKDGTERLCFQLWHEAKLALRETSIARVLKTMVSHGAAIPCAGLREDQAA